jgi:hypothetical protein
MPNFAKTKHEIQKRAKKVHCRPKGPWVNPFHDGFFLLLKALSFQYSLLLQLKLHFFKSCVIHIVVSILDTHFLKSLLNL